MLLEKNTCCLQEKKEQKFALRGNTCIWIYLDEEPETKLEARTKVFECLFLL